MMMHHLVSFQIMKSFLCLRNKSQMRSVTLSVRECLRISESSCKILYFYWKFILTFTLLWPDLVGIHCIYKPRQHFVYHQHKITSTASHYNRNVRAILSVEIDVQLFGNIITAEERRYLSMLHALILTAHNTTVQQQNSTLSRYVWFFICRWTNNDDKIKHCMTMADSGMKGYVQLTAHPTCRLLSRLTSWMPA